MSSRFDGTPPSRRLARRRRAAVFDGVAARDAARPAGGTPAFLARADRHVVASAHDIRVCARVTFFAALLFTVHLSAAPLRVCADPNNLPFSNRAGQGFENKLARIVARDLGATGVEYYWFAQRRGFVRNTLNARKCDVIMGVPSSFELALTTRPYYRSGYVFVTRRDRRIDITSLNDPRLRELKIGVQLIGDDYASSPPAHALANRGIVQNVVGYPVYGDYTKPDPTSRIVDAVAKREVDLVAVWGPTAGYFAKKSSVPLAVTRFTPQIDLPFLPFVFDISMGVRRGDTRLRDRLNQILEKRRAEIDAILHEYGVPRLDVREGT